MYALGQQFPDLNSQLHDSQGYELFGGAYGKAITEIYSSKGNTHSQKGMITKSTTINQRSERPEKFNAPDKN